MTQAANRKPGRPKGTGGRTQSNPMYNSAFRDCVLATARRVGLRDAAKEWGVAVMTIHNWLRGA